MEDEEVDDVVLLLESKARRRTTRAEAQAMLHPRSISDILKVLYILIPDPLRRTRQALTVLSFLMLLLLLLPLRIYFLLLMLGVTIGYVAATEHRAASSQFPSALSEAARRLLEESFHQGDLKTNVHSPESISMQESEEEWKALLSKDFELLVRQLMTDLIMPWWLALSSELGGGRQAFLDRIHSAVLAAFGKLVSYSQTRSKDAITLLIYGVTNAMIVHMAEFREWEQSGLSMDEFIATGRSRRRQHAYVDLTRSPRSDALKCQAELEYLRSISEILMKRLISASETKSSVLRALVTELLAHDALRPLFELLSDPDWINRTIVQLMQRPDDALESVPDGWHVMTLRMVRAQNLFSQCDLSSSDHSEGVAVVLSVAGKRIKTDNIVDETLLPNEVFKFKLSDRIVQRKLLAGANPPSSSSLPSSNLINDKDHSSAHAALGVKVKLQLMEDRFIGTDEVLGTATLIPQFTSTTPMVSHLWAVFHTMSNSEQSEEQLPRILFEVVTISGKSTSSSTAAAAATATTRTTAQVSKELSMQEVSDRSILLSLMKNHEAFLDLLEYCSAVKAPPYIQFIMNLDALHQFMDSSNPNPNQLVLQSDSLVSHQQREWLSRIKKEAQDVFWTHFSETSKYCIPIAKSDDHLLFQMQADIDVSDLVVEHDGVLQFKGRLVGADIFKKAYDMAVDVFIKEYFGGFKSTDSFLRWSTLHHAAGFTDSTEGIAPSITVDIESKRSLAFQQTDRDNMDGLRKIATEIALCRQRILLLQESSQQQQGLQLRDGNLKKAHKELESLLRLFKEMETEMIAGDDLLLDLHGKEGDFVITVRPVDASSSSIISSGKNSPLNLMLVRAWRNNKVERSVVKPLSDFVGMHKLLKRQFPKIAHIPFPVSKVHGMLSAQAMSSAAAALEKYISLLTSDEVVCQSGVLRRFLSYGLDDVNADALDDTFEMQDSKKTHRSSSKSLFSSVGGHVWSAVSTTSNLITGTAAAVAGYAIGSNGAKTPLKKSISSSDIPAVSKDPFVQRPKSMVDLKETLPFATHSADSPLPPVPNDESSSSFGQLPSSPLAEDLDVQCHVDNLTACSPPLPELPNNNTVERFYKAVGDDADSDSYLPMMSDEDDDDDESVMGASRSGLPKSNNNLSVNRAMEDLHGSVKKALRQRALVEDFSESEVDMMVEICFAFVTEAFDLQEPSQWLRRKLLSVFKQLLKQAYGDTLSKSLTDFVNAACSSRSMHWLTEQLDGLLYPRNVPAHAPRTACSLGVMPDPSVMLRSLPEKLDLPFQHERRFFLDVLKQFPLPKRSNDECYAAMVTARSLLLRQAEDHTPLVLEGLVGRYGTAMGVTRIHNSLQHREFNKLLLYSVLDVIMRMVFAEFI